MLEEILGTLVWITANFAYRDGERDLLLEIRRDRALRISRGPGRGGE